MGIEARAHAVLERERLDDPDALQRLLQRLENARVAGELVVGDRPDALISLRRTSIAGGTTMMLNSDITGSCQAITATRATSVNRSRPIDVTSKLSTWLAAAAPVVSRARNSDVALGEEGDVVAAAARRTCRR